MTTVDVSTELFCRVAETMGDVPTHPQAQLSPRAGVTVALLCALNGDGARAFSRWLVRDYRPVFPHRPARTRLFRLVAAPQSGTEGFLAEPSVRGGAARDGVALLHP